MKNHLKMFSLSEKKLIIVNNKVGFSALLHEIYYEMEIYFASLIGGVL